MLEEGDVEPASIFSIPSTQLWSMFTKYYISNSKMNSLKMSHEKMNISLNHYEAE